jgi:hypothetical protein
MFGLFGGNKKKKLEKAHADLLEKAMHLQRKGDIAGFSKVSFEADEILKEIEAMEASEKKKEG